MRYITFVDGSTTIRSDTDLGLVISSIEIEPPEPQTRRVSVPGMDGVLDYSNLFGDTRYDNRYIRVSVGCVVTDRFDQEKTVRNALHGKQLKITISDDSDYYYSGRVSVGTFRQSYGVISGELEINCDPWKYKQADTVVARSDLTTSYKQLSLANERRVVIPTIVVGQETTLLFNGNTYTVAAGTHRLLAIELQPGSNLLKAKLTSGSGGSISVSYREASL